MSNINNNNLSNPNIYKASAKFLIKNLNSNINNLTPEELKFFLKDIITIKIKQKY